jgi:hypothetical protein
MKWVLGVVLQQLLITYSLRVTEAQPYLWHRIGVVCLSVCLYVCLSLHLLTPTHTVPNYCSTCIVLYAGRTQGRGKVLARFIKVQRCDDVQIKFLGARATSDVIKMNAVVYFRVSVLQVLGSICTCDSACRQRKFSLGEWLVQSV